MPSRPQNGRRALWVGLLLVASYGCATSPSPYQYKVQLPMLEVAPKIAPCEMKDQTGTVQKTGQCVTLYEPDYRNLIVELKAACLGTGGTPAECRTEE